MSESSVVVGIDIAKAHVDVAVLATPRLAERFTNDDEGHRALIERLAPLDVQLVVMEATGGYEAPLACALQAAGLAVAVINPRQGRDFLKAMGRLAKTDRIDAEGLAEFGRVLLSRDDLARYLKPLTSDAQQDLAALVDRRRQLVTMLGMERQRLSRSRRAVRPSIKAVIKTIERQLERADHDMNGHVKVHFAALDQLLRSTSGIGPVARDSGRLRGRRRVQGGRAKVRRTLYMATIVATRHNPVIRAHYQHLVDVGKAKKVAIVACMRKLLTILNAMAKSQTPFDPDHARA